VKDKWLRQRYCSNRTAPPPRASSAGTNRVTTAQTRTATTRDGDTKSVNAARGFVTVLFREVERVRPVSPAGALRH